ncbi:MAG: HesB/YadR/YfhF-family protein [Conexibacteraceae bacterium]|nr:HesB/YadR/YfhF-family protein [Conexibacteraceae bacterium]
MLALTQDATEVIEGLLAGPGVPEGAGVRIASAYPNEADAPGTLQVRLAVEPGDHDEVIEEAGARVFVEDAVTQYLDDKLLDVNLDGEQVRFALLGQA